ncbi:ABC transporter substrate-binding protein, partial [Nocardioides sp. NPDC057772]|uniref:ABC transporter substrate-binding protein n=1 Tax=Nocardioides sp. NPDC057772 TaxID=3346245 RepID=UPI0036731578
MTGHRGPRRSRRASLLAVTAVVAMAALTACGGSGSDSGKTTLTLTWWGDDSRAEKYEEAVALFEEQNPDIDVKTSFTDWDGYWTARSTEAAGKSLPDVMQFDLSYLREYSQSGQLLDLADYTGEQIDVAGMDENLVKAGEVDGAQLGVPVATNTLALFVNTTLAKEAGVEVPAADYTWDDLNKFTADVSAAGVKSESGKQVYGGGDYVGTMWFFMTWLKQQGIEPFGEDGSFNFGEEEVVEYLELTKDLRADKAVFPAARDV